MTWLLKLYPPRWRRRYGDEFTELITAQAFSLTTVVDVVAGAIDAWINPQPSVMSQETLDEPLLAGETTMLARMLQLRCAGCSPKVSRADALKGMGVTLAGALTMLALAWWVRREFDTNQYVEALILAAICSTFLLSLPFTSLKGRPAAVQAVFIGGLAAFLTLAAFVSVLI